MTTPGGDITRYTHDTQGNLLTVTWPDGNIKRYHYEDSRFPRALTGITDETGQRIGSYTYDAQGRVSETQRASGVDRLQFSYGQDASGAPQTTVTDFSTGTPTTRTHRFTLQGRVLRPAGASAPCPLCGSTAQTITYDEAGRKLRELQHDGSVVFYKHNERGLQTERATFPSSFATATTRPGLARATSVVSTQWHATWSLPRRVAEPGRITEYTYNQRGITSLSSQATTDTTGAAKFTSTPTGPLSSTEYNYNAQHFNTRITELIGWLTQVGIILSGQTQTSSTPTAPAYDKAGLLVSPQACMEKPGNCDPGKWKQLQDDVNDKCKSQSRRCEGNMVRTDLLARLDLNRTCAISRDKINKTCFAGGDQIHRDAAIEAWNAVARCEKFLGQLP